MKQQCGRLRTLPDRQPRTGTMPDTASQVEALLHSPDEALDNEVTEPLFLYPKVKVESSPEGPELTTS